MGIEPTTFTRANAQWVIHGFISTLIYTSELILCFTICVLSATRHNIHQYQHWLTVAAAKPCDAITRLKMTKIVH